MLPRHLPLACQNGASLNSYVGPIEIERISIASLVIPTGRIVACDPMLCDPDLAFDTKFPTGNHPVDLCIGHISETGDQRNACAMIRFSNAQPLSWHALNPATYGVDSGLGCFLDSMATVELQHMLDRDFDMFSKKLDEGMASTYIPTRAWTSVVLNPLNGANIVVFDSGWGDGVYESFVGFDKSGRIAALVTHFGLLFTKEEADELTRKRRRWWAFWERQKQ